MPPWKDRVTAMEHRLSTVKADMEAPPGAEEGTRGAEVRTRGAEVGTRGAEVGTGEAEESAGSAGKGKQGNVRPAPGSHGIDDAPHCSRNRVGGIIRKGNGNNPLQTTP